MFSSMSMGQKAGSGLTSAIMGGILSAAYFDGTKATAAEQSAEAIRVIKGFYLYVPIAIWVVMFVIAACYQLDKVYDKMMRELIQRESGEESGSVPGEIQSMPLPEAPETGSTWQLEDCMAAVKKDCRGCCKSTGLQGL